MKIPPSRFLLADFFQQNPPTWFHLADSSHKIPPSKVPLKISSKNLAYRNISICSCTVLSFRLAFSIFDQLTSRQRGRKEETEMAGAEDEVIAIVPMLYYILQHPSPTYHWDRQWLLRKEPGSLVPAYFSGAVFTCAHFQKIVQISSLCVFGYQADLVHADFC